MTESHVGSEELMAYVESASGCYNTGNIKDLHEALLGAVYGPVLPVGLVVRCDEPSSPESALRNCSYCRKQKRRRVSR